MFRSMKAISRISAAKVDTLLSTLSSTPTLANKWYMIGNEAARAGTLDQSLVHRCLRWKKENHRQASNLCHDGQECNGTDEGTLATHIATCDDLEPRLLSCVDIVRYKFRLHDLLTDGMTSVFESQGVADARSNCALLQMHIGLRWMAYHSR
jgi:hypothetical protein